MIKLLMCWFFHKWTITDIGESAQRTCLRCEKTQRMSDVREQQERDQTYRDMVD